MDNVYGTTPFGQRPMSLAMLAAQRRTQDMPSGLRRGKWKLFRAVCEARPHLGLTDRALTVLDALLTFHPGDELDEAGGLIVFPSNAQLSLRARAMTPATRVASTARLSASVRPEMRMARACRLRGGVTTLTTRGAADVLCALPSCLASTCPSPDRSPVDWPVCAAFCLSLLEALPTEENSPVPIQAAKPMSTTIAASL